MSQTQPARFDLDRFVKAQATSAEQALAELKAGRKRSHWMWFIFPQLRGLGHSPTAIFYALASLDEARAYLDHSLLGPRLHACTEAVLALQGRSLHAIFASPDDVKFRSSMTLFARAFGGLGSPFRTAIDLYCDGRDDERTSAILDEPAS